MSDNRLKFTITDDERTLFARYKIRESDSLAGTIVRLAIEQIKYLKDRAAGKFNKTQTTGGHRDEGGKLHWADTSSSQE